MIGKNDFDVISKLGEGGQGMVFLVKEKKTGNFYARKRVECEDIDSLNGALNEVQAMLKLQHRHIVQTEQFYIETLKEFGETKYIINILMEYCSKKSLDDFIKAQRNLEKAIPISLCLKWFREIIEGLYFIHRRKYIHRDIKPLNIFLAETSNSTKKNSLFSLQVKIGDFGFAKLLKNEEFANTILGSRNFLSPEILKGEKYTNKIDVWSAICVLIAMMSAKEWNFAFQLAENSKVIMDHLEERYTSEKEKKYLFPFIKKIFRLDPSERPNTKELLDSIDKVLEEFGLDDTIEDEYNNDEDTEINNIPNLENNQSIGKQMQNIFESPEMVKRLIHSKDEEIYFLKAELSKVSSLLAAELEGKMKKKQKKEKPLQLKDFELLGTNNNNQKSKYTKLGKTWEIKFAKWKKKGIIVALKSLRNPSSLQIHTFNEFKEFLDFPYTKEVTSESIGLEKIYGLINDKKEKNFYVVTEAFLEETKFQSLRRYLLNFNHKIQIFGKIKFCLDIATGIYELHKQGCVHQNLSIKYIFVSPTQRGKNKCKITGTFFRPKLILKHNGCQNQMNRESRSIKLEELKKKDVKQFLLIMKQIFIRCSPGEAGEENELKKLEEYKPKNEFEEDYFRIIQNHMDYNIKNLVFLLSQLKQKQWLCIKNLVRQKKNGIQSDGFLILNNLKNHKVKLVTNSNGK